MTSRLSKHCVVQAGHRRLPLPPSDSTRSCRMNCALSSLRDAFCMAPAPELVASEMKHHRRCVLSFTKQRCQHRVSMPFRQRILSSWNCFSLENTHILTLNTSAPSAKLLRSKNTKHVAQFTDTISDDQRHVRTARSSHTRTVSQQYLRCAEILSSDWLHSRDNVHSKTGITGVSLPQHGCVSTWIA
jgi:hypothetical protein